MKYLEKIFDYNTSWKFILQKGSGKNFNVGDIVQLDPMLNNASYYTDKSMRVNRVIEPKWELIFIEVSTRAFLILFESFEPSNSK